MLMQQQRLKTDPFVELKNTLEVSLILFCVAERPHTNNNLQKECPFMKLFLHEIKSAYKAYADSDMSSGNEEAQLAQCQAYVQRHNIQQLVKEAIAKKLTPRAPNNVEFLSFVNMELYTTDVTAPYHTFLKV
ncbi:hypothetical protein NECAME_13682 [Necator americanus]|uniref:Uncharacterized protein n=1 Tax=Necator americanus TaxID=51031 RepID=W2STU4_NECAM|nr:hypothetical protein NECAME_13682 [Necator americanus]ETN72923.1 hypothetical protein NECAME_13682 [Necator americanus]